MATQVVGCSVAVEVQPTISTTAYNAEAQIGGIQFLTGAAYQKFSLTTLVSVTVADRSKNTKGMTLFFFDSFPTVNSLDTQPLNVTDGDMRDKCIGHIAFTSADYATVSGSSIMTAKLGQVALTMRSKTNAGTIYAVAKMNEAGTYAVNDLLFRYLFSRDA